MQKTKPLFLLLVMMLAAALALAACGGDDDNDDPTPDDAASDTSAAQDGATGQYTGKKVLFIDSYNTDYDHSSALTDTVASGFEGTGVELKFVHMDTKNNPEPAFAETRATEVKAEIDAFDPDVIIACDDNAQKYVIVPYVRDTGTPVVFCGVNWNPEPYGYPTETVTGMVEVDLADPLVTQLSNYADGTRIGFLSADTVTERNTAAAYQEYFFDGEMTEYWVSSYDQFTETFVQAQSEVDMLLFVNNAGIRNWDDEAAKQFALENTTIPTGSVYAWMADFVLMDLASRSSDQAEWAVGTTLAILDGTSPGDIPLGRNQAGDLYINLSIAEQLDIAFEPNVLRNAVIVE